jgi:DNA-binding NtrC family response regulator
MTSQLNVHDQDGAADRNALDQNATGRNTPMATAHLGTNPIDSMSRTMEQNRKLRLLVVDGDKVTSSVCCELAAALGLITDTAPSPRLVPSLLRDQEFDVLVVNFNTLRDCDLALLGEIKELHPSVGIVVISASGSIAGAVEVMRAGATEYLPKPFTSCELTTVLKRAVERCTLQGASLRVRETDCFSQDLENIIGYSRGIEQLHHILPRVAKGSNPVMIIGERGVGKELVARRIHAMGLHVDRPFISVDCGSLVPTLMASELFGFVKEPLRNADRSRNGLLASPAGATMFLNNIDELPTDLQAKLVQVLTERDRTSLDDDQHIDVTARVLAGANQDLASKVEHGRFRKDLYYRLSVFNIRIPSLRERKQDIPLLVAHFLEKIFHKTGIAHALSNDAMRALVGYDWPGNVGELQESLASASSLSSGAVLHVCDLPTDLQKFYLKSRRATAEISLHTKTNQLERRHACSAPVLPIADLEKQAILNALSQMKGDKISIARQLGIGKTTLYRKLREYSISETGNGSNECT